MTAYFVRRPSTIQDLMRPHLVERERPFEIVERVTVRKLDYENFIWDLLPEREFLLAGYGPCYDTTRCLLVHYRGAKDGILVTTLRPELVEYAAYYRGEHTQTRKSFF